MLGPFATASRRTPLFYIAIHQVSLLSHAATVARRLRINVHDNDDNNDNRWQRDRYGPIEWANNSLVTIASNCAPAVKFSSWTNAFGM